MREQALPSTLSAPRARGTARTALAGAAVHEVLR